MIEEILKKKKWRIERTADWQWRTHTWREILQKSTGTALHHCSARLYLISLSMCVEVLDISIIGLAIGGLVHMVPHLSLHTQRYHSDVHEVEQGFDCQLYVTTHSHCACSPPLWWPFPGYSFSQSSLLQFVAIIKPLNETCSFFSMFLMDWLLIHLSQDFWVWMSILAF